MKLQISASSACAFARLAVTARIVCGVLIDMPELLNAGWLAVIAGALLALPAALAFSHYQHNSTEPPKALCGAFCLISVLDAATVSSCIADSASYLALNTSPAVYLTLPQLALCLFCLRLNGDSLGTSAGIWGKLLPWLLLIVVFLQAKKYRPEWLTPVLGPGVRDILSGGLRTAGWFLLPFSLYLIAEPSISAEPSPLKPVRTLGICACFAVIICLIAGMNTPAIVSRNLFTRAFRLDAILANGRTGLAQQLPVISLWYLGLFYALLFDIFTASALLQKLRPSWHRHACIWITLIAVGILGADLLSGKDASVKIADWLFVSQGILLMSAMLLSPMMKRGASHE